MYEATSGRIRLMDRIDADRDSKLGPYEVKSSLGAGGMGEVFRARDTRLNHDVAVKVMHEDAASPERRARFEREARTVAALNHPNIVSVFDFGAHEGVQCAVSELVEGETLRALIRRGPVPVRKLRRDQSWSLVRGLQE